MEHREDSDPREVEPPVDAPDGEPEACVPVLPGGERWAMYGAALLALFLTAGHWSWAATLAFPVVCGAVALSLFEPDVRRRWLETGYLMAADASVVALVVLGAARLRPFVLAGLLAVVVVGALAGDRRRGVLASLALVGCVGVVGATVPVGVPRLVDAYYVPLLIAAAFHFAALGCWLPGVRAAAERSQDSRGELWALFDISETITSTLDVDAVMHSIVERVGDLVDTPSCSILLADSSSPDCLVLASKGHPEARMRGLDLRKYPEIRHALTTRQPVVIDDVAGHPLIEPVRDLLMEKGYRSMLVMPLLYGKELIGALFIKTTREHTFSPRVMRFCKVAAGISANALKNALLFRDVKQTSEKLRRVLDSTPDMIVATDEDGRVTEFNSGAETLTGWSGTEAVGHPLAEVFDCDGLQADDDPTPVEVPLKHRNGTVLDLSLVSAPLSDAEGLPSGRVWIGRDVTKLRRVERSLMQAERLSSLGEVVAGVAHELNNPLSGVVGYAELLRAHAEDPDQIRDLDRIVDSAMRCQKIVFKLLSFARKHAPEKRYQDVNECVEKVLDLKSYHLKSAQIQTVLELDPDLPWTSFDFHQIDQVLLNLLNNAEQAVRSKHATGGKIVLRTGTEHEMVFIEVADDGPGVADEVRERIFDPFFTTKDIGQGTGLGLSVSYGIVEEHGGKIDLSSDPFEAGARFRIWLPIVEGEPVSPDRPGVDAGGSSAFEGRRILVADDEPTVLEVMGRLLAAEGAKVTLAQDGQEAWDRLSTQEFDLIVADVRMPNLSGEQLYERVAAERPELLRRFVFATGDLMRQETLSFLQGLPNRILTKPLELETVRRVLSQAMDSAAA